MKTTLFSLGIIVLQLRVCAGGEPAQDYVAHEWGTFTSVQGADGVQIEWNPLVTSELPAFVYDRNRPNGLGQGPRFADISSKSAFVTLQRMETPVIYFYSPGERSVDVSVKFPDGIITEWYPQVASLSASEKGGPGLNTGRGALWRGVRVLPQAANQALDSLLPTDPSGSHYYAARHTDAAFLRVQAPQKGVTAAEHEKFLFYRGVGSFSAPLQASLDSSEDYVELLNKGSQTLTHLFVLNLRRTSEGDDGITGKFMSIDRLQTGESRTVKMNAQRRWIPLSALRPQMMQALEHALASDGLYEAEAKAMVQTWQDSWFSEEGLRVLYVLPRAWTDQILPLKLSPEPRELVRVMVGRAEIISPSKEWGLLKQIVKFSESDETSRPGLVEETRRLGLGRFSEPTVRLILGKRPSREFSQQAWALLDATRPVPTRGKGLAVK